MRHTCRRSTYATTQHLAPRLPSSGAFLVAERGHHVATFPPPRPLPERITLALAHLRQARYDGCATRIAHAQIRFDELLDQLPR